MKTILIILWIGVFILVPFDIGLMTVPIDAGNKTFGIELVGGVLNLGIVATHLQSNEEVHFSVFDRFTLHEHGDRSFFPYIRSLDMPELSVRAIDLPLWIIPFVLTLFQIPNMIQWFQKELKKTPPVLPHSKQTDERPPFDRY